MPRAPNDEAALTFGKAHWSVWGQEMFLDRGTDQRALHDFCESTGNFEKWCSIRSVT